MIDWILKFDDDNDDDNDDDVCRIIYESNTNISECYLLLLSLQRINHSNDGSVLESIPIGFDFFGSFMDASNLEFLITYKNYTVANHWEKWDGDRKNNELHEFMNWLT